jgi:hypothetical protein
VGSIPTFPTWRNGRAVDGSGLENRSRATYRGFESLFLRLNNSGKMQEWFIGTPFTGAPAKGLDGNISKVRIIVFPLYKSLSDERNELEPGRRL